MAHVCARTLSVSISLSLSHTHTCTHTHTHTHDARVQTHVQDELDSLGGSRDRGDMHEASRRLLSVLLRCACRVCCWGALVQHAIEGRLLGLLLGCAAERAAEARLLSICG